MTKALQSPHEVNAAAYLAATQGRRSSVSYVSGAGQAITALRIQGPGPSVSARLEELYRLLSDAGDIEELHAHNSKNSGRRLATSRLCCLIELPPSGECRFLPPLVPRSPHA